MGSVVLHFSMSLDGFIAGPGVDIERPMGEGGLRLHDWLLKKPGNEVDINSAREILQTAGAIVLGKRTFDVGIEPWGDTPYPVPCFVLTHEVRDALVQNSGTFAFVNDGIDSALRQAKAAAGGRNVVVMGADIAQQCLKAGLADEINLQLVPVLMGHGRRLFERLGSARIELERMRVIESPQVTHLRYRVVK